MSPHGRAHGAGRRAPPEGPRVSLSLSLPFTVDADLPALLQRLHAQDVAGDAPGGLATLSAIGPDRLAGVPALVGALCRGGVDFALRLAEAAGVSDPDQRLARVLDAYATVVEPPPQAAADHEQRLARALVEQFAPEADPAALLDVIRAEFLVGQGPLEELPEAVLGALRHQRWDLALHGLQRLRDGLQDRTPKNTYGLGAMCLHRLGRLDEAERWVRDGLGPQQAALLAPPPVHDESTLLRRWGRFDRPRISIVCTTYNHERYIDSAIRGFLGQDCSHPFEILIHDDASTDGTQAVIRRWHAQYPTLVKPLLQTENQKSRGVHPFELLLARAQGDFVATCEGDDFWIDARKLQRQVDFLIAHPDVSCSAHNYYHFIETTLTLRPWSKVGRDFYVSPRQMMATQVLLWLPTLVFRKAFSALPPERAFAAFGDQFLVSWLGTFGRCAYLETMTAAVRRENEFSSWSPLPETEKERRRVKTWTAMLRLHQRLGNTQAVLDLQAKLQASKLDPALKASILDASAHLAAARPVLEEAQP